MDIGLLQQKFGRMGARVKLNDQMRVGGVRFARRAASGIDIRMDAEGEFFDLRVAPSEQVSYEVIDLRPEKRHLLLMARREQGRKEKFLCGHDERHWFVCAVPGAGVAHVRAAMESLQPAEVRRLVNRRVKRVKDRLNRRNEVFVRQGEWFFIPSPDLATNAAFIHRNEPISRGRGSKPHMCEQLYRFGGEAVMVCPRHPDGVTQAQYQHILRSRPKAKKWDWRPMRRDALVYVRGRVWHPDHKTIVLADWHRVLMNTENLAPWSDAVVFLD